MKQLAKVLVGSRLHGLHTPTSDYDYRGIHIHSLSDKLSPFKTLKNTTWIEGDEDNTSYELADFCKQAVHGNATILEVFFSDRIIHTDPIHTELRKNWRKFIDTKRFVAASRGYAHNQWNKFYNFEDVGGNGQHRTAKFAVAFLRVMWQCEQFLLTGEFKCNLEESDLYPLLKKIKPMNLDEIRGMLPEIMVAMDKMERRVSVAQAESKFMDMQPDIEWIEDFIHRAYTTPHLFMPDQEVFVVIDTSTGKPAMGGGSSTPARVHAYTDKPKAEAVKNRIGGGGNRVDTYVRGVKGTR